MNSNRVTDILAPSDTVQSLRRGWWVILLTAVLFALAGVGYCMLQQPVYRATASLYVTSGTEDSVQTAYQGSLASQLRVASYSRLVTSDSILRTAIDSSGVEMSVSEAKSAISASAPDDTVLLNVSAQSTDVAVAEDLANAVSSALIGYVSTLETPAGGGSPLAKVTVVSPAVANSSPVSPQVGRIVGLATALGLLISSLGVVLRGRYSTSIRSEGDIVRVSDLPVLASVPKDEQLGAKKVLDFSRGATPAAEAFRKLRTALSFYNVDSPPRVLLVTSPISAEGKTTTAMNLVAALAESGSRAILVDADLRRPQVGDRSGSASAGVGLTNWLRGDMSLQEVVQAGDQTNSFVLAAGPLPPNPAEMLESKRLGDGIAELASLYDYVVVDSPPVLPVADSSILSRWCDAAIVVVRAGRSSLTEVRTALNTLEQSQANVIGFVLGDCRESAGYYAYGYASADQKAAGSGGKKVGKSRAAPVG
ncbi:polysaccharide biosynthesis tyrosine autokinase [Gordonia sp. NPDC057258]